MATLPSGALRRVDGGAYVEEVVAAMRLWDLDNEPDDGPSGRPAARLLSPADARQLASWGPTVSRWANEGDLSLLVTELGSWPVTPEDVAQALERLGRGPA